MRKLKAKELRDYNPTPKELGQIKRNPIIFVLDEVLDTFNIGSFFRLADAVAAQKMYLCGEMETPPSSRIHKSAVGTENWVPWIHKKSALEAVVELQKKGFYVVAVEQHPDSISYSELQPQFPIALVLGHETKGISEAVLRKADVIVELPMHGVNKSFNVWGSAAVISYQVLRQL
jgi:tRNA G18 (ribose-2'-O)-methylase SpoU